MVLSKYIFCMAIYAICCIVFGLETLFVPELGTSDIKLFAFMFLVVSVFIGIYLPVQYKLGYEKTKFACAVIIVASPFILPLIMRTSEEALKSVPDSYREASFGLGAGKLRTIFKIVLPAAMPGVLSGIILATGRVVGETAALMYTAGTVAQYAGPMDAGRTLALHMYVLSSEGLHMKEAFATAVVLLVMVLLINAVSSFFAKKLTKGQ